MRITVEKMEMQKILWAGGTINDASVTESEVHVDAVTVGYNRMKGMVTIAKDAVSSFFQVSRPAEVDIDFLSRGNIMQRGTVGAGSSLSAGATTQKNDSSITLLLGAKTFRSKKKKGGANSLRRVSVVREGDDESKSSSSSEEDSD
jgi:hypothetical protein